MQASKLYLYLWEHRFWDPEQDRLLTRVCFGITGHPDGRVQGYEGHVGHRVVFAYLWQGPERAIRELEIKIKTDFREHLFNGHLGAEYEWLTEDITLEQIANWVKWEVEDVSTITTVAENATLQIKQG
jgi:hypothetical protein